MKTILATAAVALAFATPSFAETSAAELFAMSNASAAETIVRETSMGDTTAALVRLALGNMSAIKSHPPLFLCRPFTPQHKVSLT